MPTRILAWVLLFLGISSAEYLSDYEVRQSPPPPVRVFAAGYVGRLYAGGLDNWLLAGAHWRLAKRWALHGEVSYAPENASAMAGAFCKWYPKGAIRTSGYEDFVQTGLSIASVDRGTAGLIGLGYGRDVLPWADASFGLRLQIRLEYALAGAEFSRTERGVLGLDETKLARTILALEVSLFLL